MKLYSINTGFSNGEMFKVDYLSMEQTQPSRRKQSLFMGYALFIIEDVT